MDDEKLSKEEMEKFNLEHRAEIGQMQVIDKLIYEKSLELMLLNKRRDELFIQLKALFEAQLPKQPENKVE